MSKAEPPRDPDGDLDDRRGLVTYLVSAVLLVVAVYLAADRGASALVVAGGVLVFMVLFGVSLLVRRRRGARAYAPWRDVMPCYLSAVDRDLEITEGNEALRRDFGDWEGRRCYRVFKQRETPCPECAAREVMADGVVRTHEASVIRRDGSVAHIVTTTSPRRNARGEIVGAVEMFTDITEIETLRLELEKSRRDYERFFDRLPSYASVIGRDLRIIEANALYRRDFGEEPRDFCYATCKGRDRPCPECIVRKTFSDGEVRSSEEALTMRDGRRVNVVVQTMPVFDDAGEIASVMEVFTDITEIKRLESRLSLMGRAVAGIAHRIKNIVMGLEGGIFVVNTGMKSSDQDQISAGWEMVESNVARVSRIVKDLLYCAKERPPSKMTVVDPTEIVAQVHGLYAERAAEFGIELTREVAEDLAPSLLDADGIHSMLCNLVANAMDACRFDESPDRARPSITIRCRQEATGDTVFVVEDTGPGIPEEFAGRVFQDFFSTKGTEGTGIGLLVVKTVAEEHGGEVAHDSTPGGGTTFRVRIPRADESGVATDAPPG